MAAHLARFLFIAILFFGTLAKADVPPAAVWIDESVNGARFRLPQSIDHENHFRLFYGTFDQDGLVSPITRGSVSI